MGTLDKYAVLGFDLLEDLRCINLRLNLSGRGFEVRHEPKISRSTSSCFKKLPSGGEENRFPLRPIGSEAIPSWPRTGPPVVEAHDRPRRIRSLKQRVRCVLVKLRPIRQKSAINRNVGRISVSGEGVAAEICDRSVPSGGLSSARHLAPLLGSMQRRLRLHEDTSIVAFARSASSTSTNLLKEEADKL